MTEKVSLLIGRKESVRLKTARGRKPSSQRWLNRQLNDPYVHEAGLRGYRSRAAFKILQLDEKYKFLKPGKRVIDLGAAPGGWSQVVATRVKSTDEKCRVFGIDLLKVEPLPGVSLMEGDFSDPEVRRVFVAACGGPVDVVLSDMAAATTGSGIIDQLRTTALAELAFHCAVDMLKEGGTFVTKVFEGGAQGDFLKLLKSHFKVIKHFKPPASRKESPEIYVVCEQFHR